MKIKIHFFKIQNKAKVIRGYGLPKQTKSRPGPGAVNFSAGAAAAGL